MSPQPDFVEIITWVSLASIAPDETLSDNSPQNDGPESHYIGNIWPESNSDPQPAPYASQTQFPHTAWQPLITSFINAWKAGGSASSMSPPSGVPAVGAIWYKTIWQNTICPKDGQGMYWEKPCGFDTGTDSLNWAVIIPAGSSGMQIRAISNNVILSTVNANPGLNFGSPSAVQAGEQRLELLDAGGNIMMSTTGGRCIQTDCPDGIYNMNYHVVGLTQGNNADHGCVGVVGGMLGSGSSGGAEVPFAVDRGAQAPLDRGDLSFKSQELK